MQAVDAESADAAVGAGPRELVLTQLGLRGTALLRWRTGDVVDEVATGACPACRRTVVPAEDADPTAAAVAVARDVRAAAGHEPTQVVVEEPGGLPTAGSQLSPRVLLRG